VKSYCNFFIFVKAFTPPCRIQYNGSIMHQAMFNNHPKINKISLPFPSLQTYSDLFLWIF
jgi:hypothetical protein